MTSRIVSLPMYAVPEDALGIFWGVLRDTLQSEGFVVDRTLAAPSDLTAHWTCESLLLSQTCGYPLTHALKDAVRLVATPVYSAPGCEGSLYSSVIVVRETDAAETLEDLRGRTAAFNSRDSQSGYNALRHAIAPLARAGRFFVRVVETGAHRLSMESVKRGETDVAAIDCVTFALAQDAGGADGLRVLGTTRSVPGLPFITSLRTSDEEIASLRRALDRVLGSDDAAPALATMRLTGLVATTASDYGIITDMENAAIAAGHGSLG